MNNVKKQALGSARTWNIGLDYHKQATNSMDPLRKNKTDK